MAYYRERVFPWLVDLTSRVEALEEIRYRVVENASGHVLEVGAGTGANLLHYPSSITSLTTIDPNPGMSRRIRRRIRYVEFPVDTREIDARQLPMKNATFDCAVATFALCSIREVDRSLAEVYRVLKPGGRLLFAEHGLSTKAERQQWQHRLNPLPKYLFDGCHINRPIAELIKAAGFTLERIDTYNLRALPAWFGCMYEGVAVK